MFRVMTFLPSSSCLVTLLLGLTSSVASAVTFSDEEFFPEDWTPVIHIYDDESPPPGPPQSAGNISREESGGTGGILDAYSHSFIFLEFGYRISTSGIYIAQTYDPGEQAISSLDYSFSVRHVDSSAGTETDAFPALLQDGRLFLGEISGSSFMGNTWQPKSWSALTANQFIAIDVVYTEEVIRPDFSAFGAPIQFGYSLTNRVTAPGTLSLKRGVDDWQADINLAAMSDIHGDGVDEADFDIWQAGYGIADSAQLVDGDFDNDGDADGLDFLKWQREFDLSAAVQILTVPESSTFWASVCCGLVFLSCRIRSTRSMDAAR